MNAQLTKRETEESGTSQTRPAAAQLISHSGTESTVLNAQPELNSIQRKSNAITAQTDSSETTTATLVSQAFDPQIYRFICLISSSLLFY